MGGIVAKHLLHNNCKTLEPLVLHCCIACAGDGCLAKTSHGQSSVGSCRPDSIGTLHGTWKGWKLNPDTGS